MGAPTGVPALWLQRLASPWPEGLAQAVDHGAPLAAGVLGVATPSEAFQAVDSPILYREGLGHPPLVHESTGKSDGAQCGGENPGAGSRSNPTAAADGLGLGGGAIHGDNSHRSTIMTDLGVATGEVFT